MPLAAADFDAYVIADADAAMIFRYADDCLLRRCC